MKKAPAPDWYHKIKLPLIGLGLLLVTAAVWLISYKPSGHQPSLLEKELQVVIPVPTPAPLPKPPTLGIEKPLDRSVKWTAYYITPIKKAEEGKGITSVFEANDGKKYRFTMTAKSAREANIEAVATAIDKNGKRRFGYRISDGVWKELPEGSMGMGNKLNALVPLHHLAADQRLYPYGSMVYLKAADGFKTQDGKILDGYFWIADTGGAIVGNHIDLFVGEEFRYLNFVRADLKSHFPTEIYPLPKAPKKLDPRTNQGLSAILFHNGFLREENVPADTVLREAVVAYQKSEPRIHPAEYGDPDAATTLWFLTQLALAIDADKKSGAGPGGGRTGGEKSPSKTGQKKSDKA